MEIVVTPGHRGPHLFERMLDPRIRVLKALTEAVPDLIVFPCGQDRRFDQARKITIPTEVQERISQGRVGLVFDGSSEGNMHKPDITAALDETITHFHAAPEQCVYITQERNYRDDYLAHCSSTGQTRPVTVLVHDYWIWESVSHFRDVGEEVYEERHRSFCARPAARARKFISLNRTPRPIKLLFLLRLIHDGLWDEGFISFGGFRSGNEGPGKPRPSEDKMLHDLPGFHDLVRELMPDMPRLERVGRRLLGMEQHGWNRLELWNAGMAVDFLEHSDSWFSVVTETEMRPRPSRITEKILKPLVNFHPFIVCGNPGTLKMVKEYGFVTFENVIDESYDEEWDPRRRFDRAYAEFMRLCRMDAVALSALERAIEDRLAFNARHGLTTFPREIRRQHESVLIDEIVKATHIWSSHNASARRPSSDRSCELVATA